MTASSGTAWACSRPGIRDLRMTARVIHHLLLSHGAAVERYRARGAAERSASPTPTQLRAGRRQRRRPPRRCELARDFDTRLFHGPVFGRGYPEAVLRFYASRGAPFPIEEGDLERIAAPTDFLGVNLYSRRWSSRDPQRGVGFRRAKPLLPTTPMGYEKAPYALGDFVRFGSRRSTTGPVDLRHGERRLRQHRAGRRPRSTTTTASSCCAASWPASSMRSPTARPTCAPTTSGRCSTTSSGPSATASASASSGPTTRPWRAAEASAHFYSDVIRRGGVETD